MTAPAPPMPPMPPGAPPMGAPPAPTALPFAGTYLSPQQQQAQRVKDASSAAYLAALKVMTGQPQGGAPLPPSGMGVPPPAPVMAAPAAPPPPLAPSPGAGPLPGLGVPPTTPAPAALPAPAPMPQPMAQGGVVGGSSYDPALYAPGTQPMPGVVPAPVILLGALRAMGALPQMAMGGTVGQITGPNAGPPMGMGIAGDSGVSAGAVGDALPLAGNALTPDEQSTLDTANAGPPAPKAFIDWLTNVAPMSDNELERDAAEAYKMDPGAVNGIFHLVRDFLKANPSDASPTLLKIMGLPGGEPDVGAQIWARRQDEQMSRRAGVIG